ncbi:hypothetical protein K439DRAFT_1623041 [Ramaria rubella]|nr:hypothetical protein K439DRAFT_1623041 [Ramaria rubella]
MRPLAAKLSLKKLLSPPQTNVATSRHGSGPAKITTLELTKIRHELQHSQKRFQHLKYQNSILIEKHRTLLAMLECGVCNETMREPCMLWHCGHIFCNQCLELWFQHRVDPFTGKQLPRICPKCHKGVRAKPVISKCLKKQLHSRLEALLPTSG